MAELPPILLVDDDEDDLFLLNYLLIKAGNAHPVVALTDPLAAQDYLSSPAAPLEHAPRPLIIFTDLKMPRITGVELTAWIRAQPRLAAIRIYMVTSSDELADKQAAEAAGVDAYLQKHPTPQDLDDLIRSAAQIAPIARSVL